MIPFLASTETVEPQHLALFFFVLVFSVWMARRARRPAAPVSRPEPVREAGEKVRRTADAALVELLEAGREMHAEVDTKIRLLNKLIKNADAEAKRLEALLRLARPEVLPPAPPVEVQKAAEPLPELPTRIAALRREGKTPAEIARELRLSITEVQLALRLASGREEGR